MRRLAKLTVVLAALMLVSTGYAGSAAAAGHHSPVLGRKHLFGKYGVGWGAHRPRHIFNGGDPSGNVSGIHWYSWSKPTANGHGSGAAFKPGGGYYSKPVRVEFHATKLGHCTTHGPLAYRKLYVREQVKPGSKHYTHWALWAGTSSICHLTYKD